VFIVFIVFPSSVSCW